MSARLVNTLMMINK